MPLRTTLLGFQNLLHGKYGTVVTGITMHLSTSWSQLNLSSSCFNAFSRVDVRVDVKIPGGVHAYVVDLRGERWLTSYHIRNSGCIEVSWTGIRQRQIYGKKHTSQHSFEPFSTPMTLAIILTHIANSILSLRLKTNYVSYRQLKPSSIKASIRTRTVFHRFSSHCRMAGWLRSWDTSGICRLEPPYRRNIQVFWRQWEVSACC